MVTLGSGVNGVSLLTIAVEFAVFAFGGKTRALAASTATTARQALEVLGRTKAHRDLSLLSRPQPIHSRFLLKSVVPMDSHPHCILMIRTGPDFMNQMKTLGISLVENIQENKIQGLFTTPHGPAAVSPTTGQASVKTHPKVSIR